MCKFYTEIYNFLNNSYVLKKTHLYLFFNKLYKIADLNSITTLKTIEIFISNFVERFSLIKFRQVNLKIILYQSKQLSTTENI